MPRRILQGTVKSTAADKTVVVEVERRFRHPMYGKFVKQKSQLFVEFTLLFDATVSSGSRPDHAQTHHRRARSNWLTLRSTIRP